jgi:hypothetical protein
LPDPAPSEWRGKTIGFVDARWKSRRCHDEETEIAFFHRATRMEGNNSSNLEKPGQKNRIPFPIRFFMNEAKRESKRRRTGKMRAAGRGSSEKSR